MIRQPIAKLADLKQGQAVRFAFTVEGISREGFVVRFQGRVVAYENVCRHLPVALDFGDGNFFTTDGRHFICSQHGAIYEPLTGLCVRGPCEGASLKPLAIEVRDGEVSLLVSE